MIEKPLIYVKRFLLGAGIMLLYCLSLGTAEAQEAKSYDVEQALKVIRMLKKIQAESVRSPSANRSRKVEVTEKQLNDYIAYRIETEKEEVMRELRMKIFPHGKIEGRILIDLKGKQLPGIFNPEMELYFGGRLETKDQAVRLQLDSLFLGEQAIQPELLDLIITIAAELQDAEAVTMNDWWALPFGIQDIETGRERLLLFY